MKYKLLSVSKHQGATLGVNIGDYIQALASSQFYPRVDGFLDRDSDLASYDGEQCKVIMNGWYMHNPTNWPPSNKICPLFVAVHINTLAKDALTSPENIAYFKKYEPIGCRDINTKELLKEKGVDTYFSGCMTLTLGERYRTEVVEDKTYIVDPIYNKQMTILSVLQACRIWLLHPKDVCKLFINPHLHVHAGHNWLYKILKTALYYKEYSRMFGRDIVMNSVYICQEHSYYYKNFKNEEERLAEAERLIKNYAKAKLVITSRIHCALPCLGLDTPVIYLERAGDTKASSCRMGGLRDMFNVVLVNNGNLEPQFEVTLPITKHNHPMNKQSWRKYADSLKIRCREFLMQSSK